MKNLTRHLGLVELPILELLDAVLAEKAVITDGERRTIVVTFGRAIKEAIALAEEERDILDAFPVENGNG